ncbi:DUF2138 domain-containing protein [Nocardia sp. NBC_00508]|uniref:hypothetical protein n=1 Tax=Nocardia sp. NBC_00508 TaxID=2975992 RepID=UPI002E8094B7|nr:hypothetical protein [Nocardia sp. NBC_00508]WUD63572.1 DUF2138 domain-containing protein [Nocardia sp. NBC_00508]
MSDATLGAPVDLPLADTPPGYEIPAYLGPDARTSIPERFPLESLPAHLGPIGAARAFVAPWLTRSSRRPVRTGLLV